MCCDDVLLEYRQRIIKDQYPNLRFYGRYWTLFTRSITSVFARTDECFSWKLIEIVSLYCILSFIQANQYRLICEVYTRCTVKRYTFSDTNRFIVKIKVPNDFVESYRSLKESAAPFHCSWIDQKRFSTSGLKHVINICSKELCFKFLF